MIPIGAINFNKNGDGLVPAVIQDMSTNQVLMLGYMNPEAFETTVQSGKVTFFSRTKNRLWTKGEESGNYLNVKKIEIDCDGDTLLIGVEPTGPVCHTGTTTCWGEKVKTNFAFLSNLETIIEQRFSAGKEDSYVAQLKSKGLSKIAQKVGEEAVEVVIEAMKNDRQLFLEESADLLFHFMVLLKAKGENIQSVIEILDSRS